LAGNLKAAANIMRTGQRGILLNGFQHDAKGAEATKADYENRKANALTLVAKMEALLVSELLVSEEDRRLINQLKSDIDRHAASFRQIADLCASGSLPEAAVFYKQQGAPAGVAMEQTASELMSQQIKIMRASAAEGRRQVRWAGISIAITAVVGVGTLLVTLFMVAGITKGLSRLSDELGEGASQVWTASAQVATSSQRLAQEASGGAAAIEETSAAAKEVASSARKSAEQAKAAANLMDTVDARVGEGNRTLGEMVHSMAAITESSGSISKIIKVIDGIAFQTNILALNAAVEAARAGESGMGFAVVADEVRNLAQRSAQAARDTAALIEDSIAKSNDGSAKLQRVAEVIHGITENTGKAKTFIDKVSLARLEEAKGVEAISNGVHHMEQSTQDTASFSEESAAASEQLSAQAQMLNNIAEQIAGMVGTEA
jgi:methyl-accepting chemotaxis protein/methyl-accepting chemotaxis protein-1 (serine sensor receptor)